MTTKEFIKDITTYEFMWRTNDVAMLNSNGAFLHYPEETIRRIAGDYQKGLKDADKLSDKKCKTLIYDFMTEMRDLVNDVRNDPFDLTVWEEDEWCQGILGQAIDTCMTISTQVDGFKNFFDEKTLDDIMSLQYVYVKVPDDDDFNFDGYYLQIAKKEK